MFTNIAMLAQSQFKIGVESLHLDSSSFSVEGQYEIENSESIEEVRITYGHSKDHRPDLKQCLGARSLGRVPRPGSHRFLKDPLFFTSSVFLNTPRRVAALAMVMGLCLLVYTLGQRQLRQALAQEQETIPNQLGKPTESPTLRWVFQCFQAVHIVTVNCQQQVSNLTDARLWILRFLGNACQKYYLLC